MSSVLPFDIIDQIIDIVGENKDTDLLKELALVSHSFLQICSKHLFATVELHDAISRRHVISLKKGFVKLLQSRPDIVKYIRKLTYKVEDHSRLVPLPACTSFECDDHLLSPTLPNFLRTIPRLNRLTIIGSKLDWNTLDSSLTSAFLHLMHLPTVNHINLSRIRNFPFSSLTPSVNLHRLDLSYMDIRGPDNSSPEIVQLEMVPKIREFHTSYSSRLTTKLLYAKRQDGRPAFNFIHLRRLSMSFFTHKDELNIRYLLQNAKLLEKLHLSVGHGRSLVQLHDILSLSARSLKVLGLTVPLYDYATDLLLAGLCEELEAMAGRNMLEALFFEFQVDDEEDEEFTGLIIQKVERVLVEPGWSALRQVSFKVSITYCPVSGADPTELFESLQFLPDRYLSYLPELESVAFSYSVYARQFECD